MESKLLSKGAPRATGYEVLEPLGAGSYGEVWLARDERTGVLVAIKFFAHGAGLQWQLLLEEVKQLAQLQADPGIVQLLDVEPEAAPPYYVMNYAERGSLARRLEQGPLPLEEALEIFRQIAEGLAYVHAKGIRHCDLKPGNILLDARGRVRIADFGQAQLCTEASPALGTFFYMAPEQAETTNQIPDTRWDVYGLGALLYVMLTGHPPREAPGLRDELAQTTNLAHRLCRYRDWVRVAPPPADHRRVPGMDRPLADLIDRCLEIDPARRLPDASAILAALAYRDRCRQQRPFVAFGLVATLLVLVLMAGLAFGALEAALSQSQATLSTQLLESDRVSAALVASVVDQELNARKQLLERYAHNDRLRSATRSQDRQQLQLLLNEFNEQQHERRFLGWILVDQKGNLLAFDFNINVPADRPVPMNFSRRDWFNGHGEKAESETEPHEPIRATHIAQPYAGHLVEGNVTGISTPVYAPGDKKTIIGVLYTPVRMADIYQWLTHVHINHGFVVLVDKLGHCLLHRDQARIAVAAGQPVSKWNCAAYRVACEEEGTSTYEDPIDHREYLAGRAPLKAIDWGVLVQHDREAAMQPVAHLRNQMIRIGLLALVTVSLLVSGMWGWLVWTLRREERLAYG